MSDFPSELKFTSSHEWVRDEGDGIYTIGISAHAQSMLGDMVFVDLPDIGEQVNAGDECAVVESVKAASDIYSPLSGEIFQVNEELENIPELVNSDPYGDGWLFQLKTADLSELDDLFSAEDYQQNVADEEE